MTGSLGESLRQAITVDDEGSHFIFSKTQPMCPLLNEKGLCKVVLELGEEGLCDTCHMPVSYTHLINILSQLISILSQLLYIIYV